MKTVPFIVIWDIDNLESRMLGGETVIALDAFGIPQGIVAKTDLDDLTAQMREGYLSPKNDFHYALVDDGQASALFNHNAAGRYAHVAHEVLRAAQKTMIGYNQRVIVVTDKPENVGAAKTAGYVVYQWLKASNQNDADMRADRVFCRHESPFSTLAALGQRHAMRQAVSERHLRA